MYGLVNRAVESLVRREHGNDAWDRIRARAGVDDETFARMHNYDDAVTYGLVEAASVELGVPAADLLRAFGVHWVRYVASEGYGSMMDVGGTTFEEFLENLDALHARVSLTYTELKPPHFRLEAKGDGLHMLHYYSDRPGLSPMVVGLLEGLAERFVTKVAVRHVPHGEDGHEIFEVRIGE